MLNINTLYIQILNYYELQLYKERSIQYEQYRKSITGIGYSGLSVINILKYVYIY